MAKYTVRTEQVDGGWIAHIDQDGLVCILQPNLPGLEGNFATEADAKTWADKHAGDLEATYEAGIAAEALQKERADAAHAANLAMVAILERLTNPTA
jgi:cation transporter-like permease